MPRWRENGISCSYFTHIFGAAGNIKAPSNTKKTTAATLVVTRTRKSEAQSAAYAAAARGG